jgi:hypothetical protein
MQLKSALRKSAELGIGLTAVTALILAGCGGGGGSTSTNTTNNKTPTAAVKITTTVTPGKGIMVGAIVMIKAADNTTVLGTATTTAAGTADVSISSTATGPFIVSVSCPASCTYFDEKTVAMVSGSASAPAMLAVVPGTAETNIGVTAATNAAAQYAIAAGPLTTTSVVAANNVVIANLGLTGITDLLTPPTIISSSATLSAAQAGTSAADKLANYSASIAIAASGVSAIQAIADYGNAWKQAAITPASGVVLPATINAATLVANAPTFTVTPIANVTTQVSVASAAAASAVAAVNSWIAEVSVPGNASGYWEQTYSANAAAAASGIQTTDVHGQVTTVTVFGNTLTFSGSDKRLVNGAWVADTDPEVTYELNSTGWLLDAQGGTAVNNLDGTITVTPTGHASSVESVTLTDISGTAIPCNNAACTLITYPVGSREYFTLQVNPADHYTLSSGSTQFPTKVTNMSGVALTALPAGAFCVQEGPGAQILKPITPAPAAGADNFNIYGAWSCSATEIANQNANIAAGGGAFQGTAFLTVHQTGNSVVPSVGLVTLTSPAALAAVPWMNNKIIGLRAGQMYSGYMDPAGTFGHINGKNKTALTAYLTANGRPALP